MAIRNKKSILFIIIIVTIIIALIPILTLIPRSLKQKFPKEDVISITMYNNRDSESEKKELAKDKIDDFITKAKKLKYQRYYNILGVKSWPFSDYTTFYILYENYEVYITENSFSIYDKNNKKEFGVAIKQLYPKDLFEELENMFA